MENLNITEAFATFAALVALALAITEYLSKLLAAVFKTAIEGGWARLISWIVGLGLSLYGAYDQIGMFGSELFLNWDWYVSGAITGILCSFSANGVFSTEIGKNLLTFILARKKKQ